MDELSDAVDYAKVPRHLRGHDTKDMHHTTEKGVLEEPNPSLDNRHNRYVDAVSLVLIQPCPLI